MATAMDWEGLLNGGIAAYKQGNYEQAIATLKKLSRCPSSTFRTKAGMGLVRVYMAQQDWASAKALCKTIGKSSKPAVRKWAIDTLKKIEARAQQSSTSESLSGFTPIEPVAAKKMSARMVVEPFNAQVKIEDSVKSLRKESVKNIAKSKTAESKTAKSKTAKSKTAKSKRVEQEPTVSMFHYVYLNGDADEEKRAIETAESTVSTQSEGKDQSEGARYGYGWRNARRLSAGRSLGKTRRQPIWFSQTFGALTLYALILFGSHRILLLCNQALRFVYELMPNWVMQRLTVQYLPQNIDYLTWKVLGALSVLTIASPWLWDLCLRFTTNRVPFSIQKLRQYSPEAASLITQRCQKRRWPVPTLWKLSTGVPILFSYGWLPRNARLVISEGLLSELSAAELATLVSYELSHWKTFYWPLLSLQGLLLLISHQVYWAVALWGNQQSGPLRWIAGAISTVSYCVFWVMRLPGVWVNRVRTYYGDRTAVQLTGNPNALTRALVKFSFALARSTEQQGYTPPTIERFSLLLPVSMDLTRSSLYGAVPLADLFAWDSQHPLRNWMSVVDTHPPLGDRLRLLTAYAKHWKLNLEIPMDVATPRRQKGLSRQSWAALICQGAPFFGLLMGTLIGLSCLLIGAIGQWLEWPFIDWMYEDPGIFWFCPLMGLSLGTFLRINRFFPDLSFSMASSQDMSERLCDNTLLPVDSIATKLSGTIVGRPGLANWLGQDLMLQTSSGLLKLHFFSTLDAAIGPLNMQFLLAFGPFGNLLSSGDRPTELIGKSVQVLGWFRRSNRVWLDVDKVRLSSGRLIEGTHPMTSLMIAVATSGLALWLLGFGQIFRGALDKIGS